MKRRSTESFYKDFGKRIQQHRDHVPGMTQEKLGKIVGLSRTSITNIEQGRQHIAVHQLVQFADALDIPPEALLPTLFVAPPTGWVADKLPADTNPEIASWAAKLASD